MPENCDAIVIFLNLLPIWSNPEAGFRTYSLKNLHTHQKQSFILQK